MSPLPDKPRLAFLIHADGDGGGPLTTIDQIQALRETFDITVLHGLRGRLSAFCEQAGIAHHRLPINRFWKLAFGFPLLVRRLRQSRPDLLVLMGQTAGPVGALAGRLAGIRHLVYVALWPSFYTNWDLWRIVRNYFCEKIPCRLAEKVIVLSEGNYYEYLYRRLVEPGRLVLLSNCIDSSRVPPAEDAQALRTKHGWNPDICHVVMVARLATQKHVDWLLSAWRLVMNAGLPAHLWIVGGGPEAVRLRAMAIRLGIDSTCTFLGPQEKGIRFMAAADVVVSTTLYEGHSGAILEAMACGRPVVSNHVDGVDGTLVDGQDGFLVQPGQHRELADRLMDLIGNPALRRKMGDQARLSVKAFDRDVVMPRYRLVYESLLAVDSTGDRHDRAKDGDPC